MHNNHMLSPLRGWDLRCAALHYGPKCGRYVFQEYMKKEIEKIPESVIIKKYPISNKLNGWYFSLVEVSNNVWQVEGSDLWGRKVENSGIDPDALLCEAVKTAKELSA